MRGRFNGRVVGQDYTGRNTRHNGRAGMYNAVQSALAPSLDITLANGLGPLFTYTRATTATVTDFEGLIKSCLSGELRIQGARRVRNWLSQTENLSNAAWTKTAGGTGVVATLTSGQTAPDGTSTAYRLVLDVGVGGTAGDTSRLYQSSGASSSVGRESWYIKSNTGATQTIKGGIVGGARPSLTITTEWQRFGFYTGTTYAAIDHAGNDGTSQVWDLLIWHPQFEEVLGQSNQNPSEYVSVGVLSSPYHGYFADGVKYFSYQNGNTVTDNVVTEAQGSAISTTIGYLAEGARTNLCLQSQTFDHATWSKTDMTVTANSLTAPDGTMTMDSLVPANNANIKYLYQTGLARSASAPIDFTIYAKKSGYDFITVQLDDASGNGYLQSWNLANGTVAATAALGSGWSISTATIESLPNNIYRCHVVMNGGTGTSLNCAISTGDNAATLTNIGDGVKLTYIWGAMIENNVAFCSTYIPTTTAAVTRNADVLTCPFAGIGNDTQGAAYIEAMTFSTTGNGFSTIPLAFSSNGSLLYLNSGDARTAINSFDGTTVVTKTGLTDISTALRKRACSWGNGGMSITGDGAAPATSVFDGSLGSTSITIGAATGGTSQWFGVIKAVRIYRSRLRDAQLQAMTS